MTSMAEVADEVLTNNRAARNKLLNFAPNPPLMPGTDYHDPYLYITVPMVMTKDKMVGKGKHAELVQYEAPVTIAIRSDGDWFEYDEENIRDRGFTPPPSMLRGEERWPLQTISKFVDEEEHNNLPHIDPNELFHEIRNIYQKYMEFAEDYYYDLMPLMIMGSYLFRIFTAVPYIHFNGTKASGKSQNMRLLKAFGFNTIWASNMSTASLFRQVSGCPGLICVDEAESFEGERGDELRKLLNAGYIKGEKATRVEPTADGKFTVVAYDVFSPKVLASINPLEPVLQSRCVVVTTTPAIRQIPEFDHDDPEWADVRDRLYLWAMQNAGAVRELYTHWNTQKRWELAGDLLNRTWQITQMFTVLAEHVTGGDELPKQLIGHFTNYFAQTQRAAEAVDHQRRLLTMLPEFFSNNVPHLWSDGQPYWSLHHLHEMVKNSLEDDQQEYYKSRKTGKDLRSLGFRETKSIKKGTAFRISEDEVRTLFRRHRIEPKDDEQLAWLNGTNYVTEGATVSDLPAAERDPEFDWVEALANDD